MLCCWGARRDSTSTWPIIEMMFQVGAGGEALRYFMYGAVRSWIRTTLFVTINLDSFLTKRVQKSTLTVGIVSWVLYIKIFLSFVNTVGARWYKTRITSIRVQNTDFNCWLFSEMRSRAYFEIYLSNYKNIGRYNRLLSFYKGKFIPPNFNFVKFKIQILSSAPTNPVIGKNPVRSSSSKS